MFIDVCDRYAGRTDKTAYSRKVKGEWQNITHDEVRSQTECFAMGLLAKGIVPGERIGIVSENRIEWAIADFAITTIGAVDVPIFPTLTAKQEAYIFNDCQTVCIIVSNALQVKKVMEEWDSISSLRFVICMASDVVQTDRVVSFDSIVELGEKSGPPAERSQKFRTMAQHVNTDDLLTLIYTSGTTGHPKGVMLTHRNITSNIAGALEAFRIDDTDVFLSYLPMCHSYERMSGYYLAFYCGTTTFFADSIETVADNMREVRPTVMTSVPRLFERIRLRVEHAVSKDSALKQKIFAWAMKVGTRYAAGANDVATTMQYKLADKLVFAKIRARTGGRLRFFVSGGAALNYDVGMFFRIIGISILEGYGLTETSPVISINREGEQELGAVGKPLPNVEVKIAPDGEILARGPSIMKGYWNMPEETASTIDPEGWLHTGDIGEIDANRVLRITDRKKNILVSSGGKNIAPQPIEAMLLQSPLIDQVLLIGDKREFCTALIVVEKEAAEKLATERKSEYGSWNELVHSKLLHDAIQSDINRLQRDLSKYERVRKFILLAEPFTVENGMMTPTLKVKRKIVEQTYSKEIEALYVE